MKKFAMNLCIFGWWVNLLGLLSCSIFLMVRTIHPYSISKPSFDLGDLFSVAILVFVASVFINEALGKKLTLHKSSYFFLRALQGFSKAWLVWCVALLGLGILFYLKLDTDVPMDGGLTIKDGIYSIYAHARLVRTLTTAEGQRIGMALYNRDVFMAWLVQAVFFFYWDGLKRVSLQGKLFDVVDEVTDEQERR
jgi:hypothetical protein